MINLFNGLVVGGEPVFKLQTRLPSSHGRVADVGQDVGQSLEQFGLEKAGCLSEKRKAKKINLTYQVILRGMFEKLLRCRQFVLI